MSSVIEQQIDYLPSETELRQILGNRLPDVFIRDYTAIKRNVGIASQSTDDNTQAVTALQLAVTAINTAINALNGEVDNIQITITALDGRVFTVETGLASHIAAESAHGANGNIVGTDDYCTATVGGTVLLAGALPNVAPVATTPPIAVAMAGATYSQPYAQSQTDAINALRQNVTDLVAANNALVLSINQMLATERTAKQRAV
jgi:hypothetical protein